MAGDLAYRLRLGPRWSLVPDHRLVQVVTDPDPLPPGRALDLGSGTGRNALYLASQGWDATGVEIMGSAVNQARRLADQNDLSVRFVRGDVTRLTELDLGGRFDLLMDGGCLHMVPRSQRPFYVDSVTAVAARGALLIISGFSMYGRLGLSRDEIQRLFTGWRLLAADPIPSQQMTQYVNGPGLIRVALRHDMFHPWRYQLRYSETG
jgi:SAM-dependent methyltransferase